MQMAHIYINKEIGKEIGINIWSSEQVGVYDRCKKKNANLSIENSKRLLSLEKNDNITFEVQSKKSILHVRDM